MSYFELIFKNLEYITPILVTLLGVILKWKKPLFSFLRNRFMFQSDMRKLIEKFKIHQENYTKDAEHWNKTSEDVKEVIKILKNGIPHKLAILTAQHQQIVKASIRPLFICNETGKNEIVSYGYLTLLGIQNPDLLDGERWLDNLHGEGVDHYLEVLKRAVKNKRGFVSSVGFKNPMTGEYRGKWRVEADCVDVNDALIFTGCFFPEDDVAIRIAEKQGWII